MKKFLILLILVFIAGCSGTLTNGSKELTIEQVQQYAQQTMTAQAGGSQDSGQMLIRPVLQQPTATPSGGSGVIILATPDDTRIINRPIYNVPTAIPTATNSPMYPIYTQPTSSTIYAQPVTTVCERVRFVDDVTIPDNTVMAPGQTFRKTWRIQNAGSCAWNSGYQLVFSGGMMSLPAQLKPVTNLIICNHGLKLITAQADYNSQPLASVWNTLFSVRYDEFSITVKVGQVLDYLNNSDDPTVEEIRKTGITDAELYLKDNADLEISFQEIAKEITGSQRVPKNVTIGDLAERLSSDPDAEELREQPVTITFTPDQLIRMVGEDDARNYILDKTSEAAKKAEYDYTAENILRYWWIMICFVLVFAALAMITLEFIDKDKR